MTAFVRTQADSAWIAGYVPQRADFEDWEHKVTGGINGDDGGTYAPTSPIVFAAGVGQTIVSGPVKVCYGARFTTLSGARFAVPGAQFEQLAEGHAGSARTVVTSCIGAVGAPGIMVRPYTPNGGLQIVALGATLDHFAPTEHDEPTRWLLPLRTCNSATLASVTLTYIANLGTPRMRIVRVDSSGEFAPLTLAVSGADTDGWVKLPAADPSLAVQSAMLTLGLAAPVVVDKSLYSYALQVEEDQSLKGGYPNRLAVKPIVKAATTGDITLRNTPTVDGVPTFVGDRVLVRAQNDPTQNGVYIVQGTGLDFAPADAVGTGVDYQLTRPDALPAGLVVRVQFGTTLSYTAWQMVSGAVTKLGTAAVAFAPAPVDPSRQGGSFAALGNVYIACAAAHTGIIDTRWQ